MGKVVKGVAQSLGALPSLVVGGVDLALKSVITTASVALSGPTALLTAAASIFAPGMPSIKQQGGGAASNQIQPMINAPMVYGRARVGGPLIFYHARQVMEGGEPVDYRYFAIALSADEIEEFKRL